MSRLFAVNANNDIFASANNRLALVDGREAVLQECEHKIRTRRGELLYAQDQGINYLSNIFSGAPNVLQFEAEAREALLMVSGVISVDGFDININDSTLEYTAIIRTIFGTGVVNGTV